MEGAQDLTLTLTLTLIQMEGAHEALQHVSGLRDEIKRLEGQLEDALEEAREVQGQAESQERE